MDVRVSPLLGPIANGGTDSDSFDVGTNPDMLVVLITAAGNNDLDSFADVTIDGEDIPFVAKASFIGRNAYLFELPNPPAMSGSVTFFVDTNGNFQPVHAVAYALNGNGVFRVGSVSTSGGAAQSFSVTMDSGSDMAVGLIAVRDDDTTSESPISGTTQDAHDGAAYFGHETAADTGSRAFGFTGSDASGRVAALYSEADSVIEMTDMPGAEAGIDDGFAVTAGDPMIFAAPAFIAGAEAGIPDGFRVDSEGPAQVHLGVPRFDRPQWTEGGEEGDVLTFHAARKPTWEEPSAGAALTVEEDGGSPTVADVDHIVFEGATVNDDGGGQVTVTITPGGVADILDLPTAETDTTLVLAPDGAGGVEWVTPAAPGGDVPPALKVYLYERFI